MENQIQTRDIEPRDALKRGLLMLLFAVAFGLGQMVLNTIAIMQFLWLLLTREPNNYLVRFGNSLAIWLADVARLLTCATDQKPFPWRPWP